MAKNKYQDTFYIIFSFQLKHTFLLLLLISIDEKY